jgi:hypothetical protein
MQRHVLYWCVRHVQWRQRRARRQADDLAVGQPRLRPPAGPGRHTQQRFIRPTSSSAASPHSPSPRPTAAISDHQLPRFQAASHGECCTLTDCRWHTEVLWPAVHAKQASSS